MELFSDTIAAIATAPGRGAIAMIRISGENAFEVAARVIPRFDSSDAGRGRLTKIVSLDTADVLDRVVYTVHRGPSSYTGEDLVEISTHGGLTVPVTVLEAVLTAGARQARPGEFTMRAVVNGKMDLLQAEAVADLIDAKAPAQRRAAISQLDRGLSVRIDKLRSRALEIQALISYDIDFPEEDDGPVSAHRVEQAAETLCASIEHLLETSRDGEMLREGALAVIAGRPNCGKSSLFNALVGFERAIVTDIEGTTRDAIEAPVTCDGFPFRLVDTAGLGESSNTVEQLGMEVSIKYVHAADLVLLCAEAGRELTAEEVRFRDGLNAPVVTVRTKRDLVDGVSGDGGVPVSALSGEGIAGLRSRLAEVAFGVQAETDIEPRLTRARHRAALTQARGELSEFLEALRSGLDTVVASVHLNACVATLEEIIGAVTTEDVLSALFSEFCVGK